MNQHRQIELAKSYRADDVRVATERRRFEPAADARPTDAGTSPMHTRLTVVRRLILRHA